MPWEKGNLQETAQTGNQEKEMADIDLTKEDLHLEEEKTGNIRMEQHMYLQTEDNLSNNKYHSIILTILLQQHWL